MAALGAQGGDQTRFAQRPEECRGGADHLGGAAHGVGGVVVVIKAVGEARWVFGSHCTFSSRTSRVPGAVRHQGPERINTI